MTEISTTKHWKTEQQSKRRASARFAGESEMSDKSLIQELADEIAEYITGPSRQTEVAELLVQFALEIHRMSTHP